MKSYNNILFLLFIVIFSKTLYSQGGDTPAQAVLSPSTFPFSNVSGTTVGKVNNVTTTATGLPTGFPSTYISGLDYFYYFCPSTSQNITVTLNYTPSSTPVQPSLLIWDGVPGVVGSTVVSSIYSSGDNTDVTGTLSTSVKVLNTKCYYIMVDNWPTPNGFAYTISATATTIANGCTNIGFESNSFADWSPAYGIVSTGAVTAPTTTYTPYCSSTSMPTGVTPQHVITSAGTDPTVPAIQMVCPLPGLGAHSMKLGDGPLGDQHGATIEQVFTVTSANAMFSYYYAVVMSYNSSHAAYEQPMFKISITDENGNNITCADYLVVASPSAPGFVSFSSGYYKDWTAVFVDLTNYIGTNVKIKYQVGDCAPNGITGSHYCYAYIDGTCSSTTKATTVNACSGVSTVLNAPMGGKTYSWKVLGTAPILGTAATLTVVPTVNTIYECTITSVTNCVTTTTVTLNVTPSPVITNPGTQTACDSYTLPTILGTALTGNQKYYNNSQALGGTQITGPITSTQTVWIYDINGTCPDEESFLVKVRKTPLASVNSPLLCTAGTTTMTATVTPTAAYSYSWAYPVGFSNPGDVASFSTTIPGTYTVTVSNANLLCSSDFEDVLTFTSGSYSKTVANASSPCWKSATTNVEFWKTNAVSPGITAYSGNQYIKVKSSGTTTVFQNFTATPNSEVTLSFAHKRSATSGIETMTVEIGPVGGPYVLLGTYTANATWTPYTVTYLIPANAVSTYTIRFNSTAAPNTSGNCLDAVSLSIIGCPAAPASGIFTISAITLNNPGPQTVCDSYTLPTITGTNLSGNQKYYNNSQALGGTVITGPITSTQTVWIYDSNGTCSDEESFLVTVNHTPVLTNPGTQTVCDSYTLPTITGTNLTGNQKYYNNSQALSGTQISGTLTTTQTVWIYDAQGTCKDEESFLVTVNHKPVLTNPGAQTVCDSYTLPTITGTNLTGNQKYYNNSQALSGTVITGPITTTQIVWMYDAQGTCKDEKSFLVTVNHTPVLTNPGVQTVCDSYTLPTITGTNLTGNQKFYNNSQALSGTQISGTLTTTQTVWIYDAQGTCKDEKSFLVTINHTPVLTNPGAQTVCDSYTLPTITGTNLTGNQKFYNNSQALSGTQISGTLTTTQTVWMYDAQGTCKDEKSFLVTINHTPVLTNPGAQTVCDSYTLPTIVGTNLTGGQKYYNNSQALSGTQISGALTSTQTVWIYDAQGICKDEKSFLVTVNHIPVLTNPGAQTVCDSYTLPTIAGTNLTGGQKYYNNSQALSGTQISGAITTTQTVWIYDAQGTCKDEKSFLVTVNKTPVISSNPGGLSICSSYTLPTITGTNLTGNQKYYNNSQALGGTVITGPILSTQTVWIYDINAACKDEESFLVTINTTPPSITNPGPQNICDSYTLPTITGTNLTGNQKYYNNSQALGGTQISGPLTSNQTIWIYDAQGTCHDEKSFTLTINLSPSITNPGTQTVCDSYTLPSISGTHLSGNQKYYNNSQALGGTVITGSITTTQTVWIYDINGICSDEESFLVTVNHTPSLTNPGAQTVCDSYTLPTIAGTNLSGNQKFYNNSQALSGTQITGPITTTQTVWIYDAQGACHDEKSFLVTILLTPSITNPGPQTVCDSYTLPTITGTNLSGGQKYYNNSQASSGTQITGPITTTQTVWIYDIQGTCPNERSFLVTVNHTPSITNPGAQTVCDSYTLPVISGTNLTGGQKFYNNSQASSGTQLTGPITTTQTVWIYDVQGTCKDEKSFLVTINHTPSIINPGAQTVCDSYTLPTISGTNLTGGQKFYNNSHALSGIQVTGPITSSQTLWIYDADGACSDEKSFLVTVNFTPSITNPGAQTVCDTYTLPTITGTHLSGNEKFYNNSQALGGTQITGPITSSQTIWIYDANATCTNEKSLVVTVNHTPSITNPGAQTVCDSYTLPTILGTNLTGGQKFYNNSHASSGIQITGPITSSQTVWIYDEQGLCHDEKSFLVTVNYTPSITNPGPQTVCDSYTLPSITGTNLSGNQKFYTNSQAAGGTVIAGPITTSQTVWMYDANATCTNEKNYIITVNHTPSITNPGAQTACDTYTLPTISGTNLTGGEKYYNNSQASSGIQISGPITSSQTVWMYDVDGACSNEKSFVVTINYTPSITNPGAQTVCDSYTLPSIIGTHLSGNQKYYNNSHSAGGVQITGPITSTQTVWIYDANATCSDEKSFLVTVNLTPNITNPGNQVVCDSYLLPTITGTNLSGNEKYFNNTQLAGGLSISGSITTTQTVWLYDANGACSNEKSYIVTVHHTPNLVNTGNQTVCDSYPLPTITGTNLSGNQKYYNNSKALGGLAITGPITYSQPVWIYDADGACTDEKSFIITINYTPSITNPGNQTFCDSYSLTPITGAHLSGNQKYYNKSQALGGTQISGTINTTQTVWIYDNNGTCSDEEQFLITIYHTPSITNPGPQTVCDSYMLPVITGTNLTGGQKYYNNSHALNGSPISGSITLTQTVWVYDIDGICPNEKSFLVTVNHTPNITNTGNQTVCDSYTLPTITGVNLTGGQKYYTNSQASSGSPISGSISTSQTIWMFDKDGACSNEKSFTITINHTPNYVNPGPQIVCDNYLLPTITGTNLSGNQNYYTNSQINGGSVISGNLTTTQTIWIYDINGNCPNEKSFLVTVNHTPSLVNPGNHTVCDSYALPLITGTNLSGNEKYYTKSQALSGTPINGSINLTQTVWIYDAQGSCSDETSFIITVNHTPNLTNPGNQTVCDSYLLPVISGVNLTGKEKFYTNSQASGGSPIFGVLTNSQTIWMYDIDGACFDEKSFDLVVNMTPTIKFTPDKFTGCVPLTVTFKNNSTPVSDLVTWDFGDGNSSTSSIETNEITHTFTTANCFNVKLTATSKGCTNNLKMTDLICTYPIPKASFIVDQERVSILNPVINFTNTSSLATSYNWYFGDGKESFQKNPSNEFPANKGSYQTILIASSANGCKDTASRFIEIYDELIFYVPNTFTPDDDDYNQVFTPVFNAGYDPENFTMYIFDRWGEIVFETHDSSIGWAGLLGKEEKMKCQDGLYIWKISYKENKSGNMKTVVGNVILAR